MDAYLGIHYKLTKSENFDEYMKALGVNLVTRKMAAALTPTVVLTEHDGQYTLLTSSTLKNHSITFKPGREFDSETADGRKVKITVTFEGNRMIQIEKGDIVTTITRDFTADEMKATFEVGNVVCTRFYEKVHK